MVSELAHVNGLYIPGDYQGVYNDTLYREAVLECIHIAQLLNEEETNHFPVIGMGYGFLAMLQAVAGSKMNLQEINGVNPHFKKRIELKKMLSNDKTFIFDHHKEGQTDEWLLTTHFYHEIAHGITKKDFYKHHELPSVFQPILSIKDSKNSGSEYIAAFEGQEFPFFGFAM